MSCKTEINFLQGLSKEYMPSFVWICYEQRSKIKKKAKCYLCYEEKFT